MGTANAKSLSKGEPRVFENRLGSQCVYKAVRGK